MADDGVDYLSPVGDHWGELCGYSEVACRWADALVSTLRSCLSDPSPGGYFHGATGCLSCLLETGRYGELLDVLELPRYPSWHDRRCGLSAAVGNSYIARFRSVAKSYPIKNEFHILSDLIAATPSEEGTWFATARELGLYDLALELANRSPCDPKTLTWAARNYLDSEPAFALGSAIAAFHWLSEGWGYEVASVDVVEAYDRAMEAAARLNRVDDVTEQIGQLIEVDDNVAARFVPEAVQRHVRATGER